MRSEISLAMGIRLSAGHAVYFRDDGVLAIADLHLGYEAALQAEHVSIPRFQLEPMLERLSGLLKKFQPETVVINGDLKHEFSHNKSQEWDEIDTILDLLDGVDVVAVRGNHDNFLQTILARRDIRMVDSLELAGGKFLLCHGHKEVESNDVFRIFAHEHPVIRMRDAVGAQITLPCFLYDPENRFLVMPAFSPLASGTNVLSPESSFMNPGLRGLDISGARVYAIHEGIMNFGKVSDLREMRDDAYQKRLKGKNTR
ncbi:MAG: metallophosphoesterase [Candidatus Thermoplasmatota archaeon]|nr:metallophosphoesterase [Candidatus Thermoplasmatota archaeon]MBU4072207.1 metallophosphoesterase [Candidatus Thermoplasmatota archaeon]MBU4145151.1 metallophosphoesterase [Candidatus Thermoplasmatota archaeon]MBU4592698.1 metallophosphoesterase [Candidatus Thermoplasmatota archaeon]